MQPIVSITGQVLNVQPLDVLMFKGSDPFSRTIRLVEEVTGGDSEFSHIEMVVNSELLPGIPELQPGKLYTMSSNVTVGPLSDGVPDIRTGKGRFGVQIRELIPVIKAYQKNKKRRVAWARLIDNPWLIKKKRKTIIKEASKFMEEHGFKPYEANIFQFLATSFCCCARVEETFDNVMIDGCHVLRKVDIVDVCPTRNDIHTASIFCSELVAMFFQRIGKIPSTVNPSRLTPMKVLIPDNFPRFLQDPITIGSL